MHLRALLTRSVEAVSFFLLLVDYNLGSLISRYGVLYVLIDALSDCKQM